MSLSGDILTGDIALAWAAGIIDGEGCISGVKKTGTNQCYFSLDVVNTDPRLAYRLKEIFGVGSIFVNHKGRGRPIYYWRVKKKDELPGVLIKLLPFLVLKKDQAKVALVADALEQSENKVALYDELSRMKWETMSVPDGTTVKES